MTERPADDDPRIYLAAERTLLAWIRTGVALMAFGFVVARLGLLARTAGGTLVEGGGNAGLSLYLGLGLIATGVVVLVASAVRHQRYIRALAQGRFRDLFGSTFAYALVILLALAGIAMAGVVLWPGGTG